MHSLGNSCIQMRIWDCVRCAQPRQVRSCLEDAKPPWPLVSRFQGLQASLQRMELRHMSDVCVRVNASGTVLYARQAPPVLLTIYLRYLVP
jgi:hypothetical protein